jgi:hypothetical protein
MGLEAVPKQGLVCGYEDRSFDKRTTEVFMIEYSTDVHWKVQLSQLRRFLEQWYGPRIDDDLSEAVVQAPAVIPQCLEEFYRVAGDLEELTVYNTLLAPSQLRCEQDRIVFYVECQGVYRWACMMNSGDNPQVCWASGDRPWTFEDEPLSGFLYQVSVYEAILGAEYQLYQTKYSSQDSIEFLLSHWVLAPFRPWHWRHYPTRFYSRDNALAIAYSNGEGLFQFHCGAHNEQHLQFMHDLVDWDMWEHTTL